MDELGSLLREAREAKGLTLAEAQKATRINGKFLEALETGQYELLPTRVHVRGYLRNYARFLGLEAKPLLDRYELSKDQRPRSETSQAIEDLPGSSPILPTEDQPFFDPVNVELSGGERRQGASLQRLIIIVALLVSIALVANRFIPMLTGNGDGTEALTAGIQEAVSSITNDIASASTATPDTSLIPGAGQIIASTERNDPVRLPTPTSTRPTLPATLDTIRMRLEITERTWMRVTVDGEIVFEGLAKRGDEPYEWEAQQEAQLLTGNAIGIFATINDVQLGRLGGRGEVVEETWTTTGS